MAKCGNGRRDFVQTLAIVVACWSVGFVGQARAADPERINGKSQTIYPWDSWTKRYDGPPPVWFHDILNPDGSPFRQTEVDYIRRSDGPKYLLVA